MTETKWTPGPWNIRHEMPYYLITDVNNCLLSQVFPTYDDKSKYNADLISAAPDLYASVERLLLEFDFMIERGVIPDVRDDIIFDNARAAMRKARGE